MEEKVSKKDNKASRNTSTKSNASNGSALDDFFESDTSTYAQKVFRSSFHFQDTSDTDLSGSSVSPSIRSPKVRQHKNSVDYTNQRKLKAAKSPRSPRVRGDSLDENGNSRPTSTSAVGRSHTPRSRTVSNASFTDDADGTATPPRLQRAGSRSRGGSSRRLIKKKGVTFRVPLEDHHYPASDSTLDSSMLSAGGDGSLGDEDFGRLRGADDGPPLSKAEIRANLRRMNKKRSRKYKKGVLPAIARTFCVIS